MATSYDAERKLIAEAQRVTVLTGAGISAESGIPTFRDALTGLWENYNPEDLATEAAFRRNPQFVWDWYAFRRERVEKAAPNAGHYALAEFANRNPGTILITQNIDGLHARAGSPGVLELHGNIHQVRCVDRCSANTYVARDVTGYPHCPKCGAWLRPDIVWFGELLPEQILAQAAAASQECNVFLCVGTSALVQPAASLPNDAVCCGATLIEVNPNLTPVSEFANFQVRENSATALPQLLAPF